MWKHTDGLEVEHGQILWYYYPSELEKQGESPMKRVRKKELFGRDQCAFCFEIWRNRNGREVLAPCCTLQE